MLSTMPPSETAGRTEAQLQAFNCSVPGDFEAGGGATVVLLGAA
jgi:hypothetical protein